MIAIPKGAAAARPSAWAAQLRGWAGAAAVALAALLPRAAGLGQFLTVDEADHWVGRSQAFLAALQSGRLADTAISAHPGVTTMWLGASGILLADAAGVPAGDFAARLALMQLPVALVNAAGVLLGYIMLRRLLPPGAALLAALLWALDPFVVGYSRVLHVDALAGTFMTLSALAALRFWHHGGRGGWLALSGICGGLALLSKSPSAAVVLWVGLLALAGWARSRREGRRVGAWAHLAPLAAWGGVAAATVLLLWPATLADPARAIELLRRGVQENGALPHQNGNYFLGRADAAPGPLFYPVALALRTTPLTLAGLLLLPLGRWRARPLARRDMAALAALALLLLVGLSLFPKKHNRYLEPAFPAVDVLAAAGLAGALGRLPGRPRRAALALAAAGAAANAAWWHPYGIASFNQLLGGAPAGAHAFLYGWGEGMEQAAAWLNRQPDIGGAQVATTLKEPLARYLDPSARVLTPRGALSPGIRYVVVYARSALDGPPDPPFDELFGRAAPAHVVTIRGVPYAWIYQVAPPVARPSGATFGGALRLRGTTVAALPGEPGAYAVRLAWETLRPDVGSYAAFVHLIGPDGRRYAQLDPRVPTAGMGAGRFVLSELVLRLPEGAPPGQYRLVVGLYDPADGRRLALAGAAPADPALDGPDSLLVDEVHREVEGRGQLPAGDSGTQAAPGG